MAGSSYSTGVRPIASASCGTGSAAPPFPAGSAQPQSSSETSSASARAGASFEAETNSSTLRGVASSAAARRSGASRATRVCISAQSVDSRAGPASQRSTRTRRARSASVCSASTMHETGSTVTSRAQAGGGSQPRHSYLPSARPSKTCRFSRCCAASAARSSSAVRRPCSTSSSPCRFSALAAACCVDSIFSSSTVVSPRSPSASEGSSSKVSTPATSYPDSWDSPRELPGFAALTQRLVQHHSRAGGEVQAARRRLPDHGHPHPAVREPLQGLLGKPLLLLAEDQPVSGAEARLPQAARPAAGEEVHVVSVQPTFPHQLLEARVGRGVDLVPVVQTGAAELFLGQRESQRRDQVQGRAGDGAQPGHVAGVGRDLGPHQHQLEPRLGRIEEHRPSPSWYVGTVSGLAIIANPNAHRNRNWPVASQALRKAAPGAALYETRTERELRDAAERVGRDRPRVVAIAGGDGTVTHTVTALAEALQDQLPPLALLGGGSYDSLAPLGGRGAAADRLKRLSEAISTGAQLETTERDTIRVQLPSRAAG